MATEQRKKEKFVEWLLQSNLDFISDRSYSLYNEDYLERTWVKLDNWQKGQSHNIEFYSNCERAKQMIRYKYKIIVKNIEERKPYANKTK